MLGLILSPREAALEDTSAVPAPSMILASTEPLAHRNI